LEIEAGSNMQFLKISILPLSPTHTEGIGIS